MPAVSPKAIVLVGPASPYRGGIAHFLKATASGLAKRGHTVEVVNFSRQYPAMLFPGAHPDHRHKGMSNSPLCRLRGASHPQGMPSADLPG